MAHSPTKLRRRSSSPKPVEETETKPVEETKTKPAEPTDALPRNAPPFLGYKPKPKPPPLTRTEPADPVPPRETLTGKKGDVAGLDHELRMIYVLPPADPDEAMRQALVLVNKCVGAATDKNNSLDTMLTTLAFADSVPLLAPGHRIVLVQALLTGLANHPDLPAVLNSHPDFFTEVLGSLTAGTLAPLAPETCRALCGSLITKTFTHPKLLTLCDAQPLLVCTMLRHAAKLPAVAPDFVRHLLRFNAPPGTTSEPAELSRVKLNLACTFLKSTWTVTDITDIGPDLLDWMCSTITVNEWNHKTQPLGPLCLNMLWVCGQHDGIVRMLKLGVDCTRSASAFGVAKREGVLTGYVQPLTHVLGKYIKSISLLGTPDEKTIKDLVRVRGAKAVVAAIDGLRQKPELVLDFPTILACPMTQAFKAFTSADQVGTIWGFEDVRLPYVQAARATKYGQRPLRMLDMWEAVQVIFEPKAYAAFIADPATVARMCAEQGAEKVKVAIRTGAAQYDDLDITRFVPAFIDTCTSFLTFFGTQIPFVKTLEPSSSTGKNATKLMPSLVCKVGLWWSLHHNKQVFYCLDGLDMNEAVGYKATKTAKINEYLTALTNNPRTSLLPFQEVITFAEVREVLKNWAKLRPVIKLVKQGTLLTQVEADAWADEWAGKQTLIDTDPTSEKRMWIHSAKGTRETVLQLLDNDTFWNTVPPSTERDCSLEFKSLTLATTADPDVLLKTLRDCTALVATGLLPDKFAEVYADALNADSSRRQVLAAVLRTMLGLTCVPLRAPLLAAINRHLAAPLALMPPPAQPKD